MESLLALWIVIGAVLVIALLALVWIVAARGSIRRLGTAVDERWAALAAVLEQRSSVTEPLLAGAPEQDRKRVADAFVAIETADRPSAKAAAEAEVQRVLRPFMQAAGSQPLGSATAEARASLTALDDETQARRRDYNTAARELNAKARRFPSSMFAASVAAPREFFEVDHSNAVAEPPRIQF
ncbi:LemA family protein [Agrococcus sp. ProA11]|uniref:LemA family protein n=1 Tax=Agrococcus chionoecetis TaxID=3153752 RepID=UPI003261D407